MDVQRLRTLRPGSPNIEDRRGEPSDLQYNDTPKPRINESGLPTQVPQRSSPHDPTQRQINDFNQTIEDYRRGKFNDGGPPVEWRNGQPVPGTEVPNWPGGPPRINPAPPPQQAPQVPQDNLGVALLRWMTGAFNPPQPANAPAPIRGLSPTNAVRG